jgi:hypothetical protein
LKVFAEFFTAVPATSCTLSFYFLWTVRDSWTEARMQRYEAAMHVIPLGSSIVLIVIALASDGLNANPLA